MPPKGYTELLREPVNQEELGIGLRRPQNAHPIGRASVVAAAGLREYRTPFPESQARSAVPQPTPMPRGKTASKARSGPGKAQTRSSCLHARGSVSIILNTDYLEKEERRELLLRRRRHCPSKEYNFDLNDHITK